MTKIYLYLEPLVTNRGVLVASRMECAGSEVSVGEASSIDECANKCEGIAEMFIFGTNDFGTNRCSDNGLCRCFCETSSSYDATCQQTSHNGYRLFKYKDLGRKHLFMQPGKGGI